MVAQLDLSIGSILIYLLAGLVIGLIARLIMPGRQRMSLIVTMLIGAVAAILGGIAWQAIFGEGNEGIAWIGSIIVALVLLWIYGAAVGRGTGTDRV